MVRSESNKMRDANGTRQRDRACSTLLRLLCCSVVASYPASCLPLMATRPAKGETVYCWHIHVYFLERNEASTANALALRNDFISQFFARRLSTEPASTFRPCTAEVNDYLCLWGCYDNSKSCLNMVPTGPHTFGSWGASMPNSLYNEVMPWLFVNKMRYDNLAGLLLHPLTAPRGTSGCTIHLVVCLSWARIRWLCAWQARIRKCHGGAITSGACGPAPRCRWTTVPA